MKKILKAALAAAVVFLTAAVTAVCASAETEDVELTVALAKMTNGKWQQSVTYTKDQFNCDRITPDSIVYVEFEVDGEWTGSGAPIEFIFQNYNTADPAIWAKIPPFDMTENSASFRYDEMKTAYESLGGGDFSTVDAIHVGDCGIPIKVTKMTISNCNVIEVVTTTTTEATTTTAAETTAAPETTAAETTTTAAPASSGGGQIPLVPIVIAAVVVAVIVVVIIIVAKSKRRFY